jgi:hypothetical protein
MHVSLDYAHFLVALGLRTRHSCHDLLVHIRQICRSLRHELLLLSERVPFVDKIVVTI